MEPVFKTLESVKLAGYAIQTSDNGQNSTDIPQFWQEYARDGRMERLHGESFVKNHSEYGAGFQTNPETGAFTYVIGLEVADGAAVPAGYHTCTLPPASYAVFSTPPSSGENFTANIQGMWRYIMDAWFPASGYEYAPGCVDFELYDERCMTETEKVCEVWIPVVKK